MKGNTRQPSSLLTPADVMTALHRCGYDLASAETSLAALERRRQSRHNAASSLRDSAGEQAAVGRAGAVGGSAAGGKNGGKSGSKAEAVGSACKDSDGGNGNRWEDWSEVDRAAFLTHLGEKVVVLLSYTS